MIRHSSSFLISIILHFILVFVIFYGYKVVTHNDAKKEAERKVKIMLCSLPTPVLPKPEKITSPTKAIVKKETPQPKVQKPKEVKKIVQKKKKIIPKKVKPVKKSPPVVKKVKVPEPIVEKIIEKEEVSIKETEIKKAPPIIEEVMEETTQVIQETPVAHKETSLEEEYLNEHIQKITELLSENLYYPRSARKRNIQGEVVVKFKLSTSADAYDIEIVSSKNEILSRAAIKTIEDLSGEFPKPPKELLLHVPITYKLNQ